MYGMLPTRPLSPLLFLMYTLDILYIHQSFPFAIRTIKAAVIERKRLFRNSTGPGFLQLRGLLVAANSQCSLQPLAFAPLNRPSIDLVRSRWGIPVFVLCLYNLFLSTCSLCHSASLHSEKKPKFLSHFSEVSHRLLV